MVILCYLSDIKLQTARISTVLMLQGRDQDRKLRINLLYTAIGGLGGVYNALVSNSPRNIKLQTARVSTLR